MDFEKIKAKLEALRNQGQRNNSNSNRDLFWKPKAGDGNTQAEYTIRILPNSAIDGANKPFIPLYFYYDFGKTWLSPFTFDEPDPVVEYCNALKSQKGSKDEVSMNWKIARKLEPKSRIYIPILVRGHEEEGVKFWGFGVQIFRALDELFDDPDWGNLADLKEGRDIKVVFKPGANDMSFQTTVTPKPKQTVATDDPAVLQKIKEMPDVTKLFTKPAYAELTDALKKYLNAEQSNSEKTTSADESKPTTGASEFDTKNFNPPTGNNDQKSTVDVSDIEAAFDNFLNSKK